MERDFVANVERLREANGWTRSELARRAGISVDTLNAWVTKGVSPTVRNIPKVAAALGVAPLTLLVPLPVESVGPKPAIP